MSATLSILLFSLASDITHYQHQDPSLICNQDIENFLSAPSERSLQTLIRPEEKKCWSKLGKVNRNLNRLLANVASGDIWSTEYLVDNIGDLKGGNLEEGFISIGQFGEIHPSLLLKFAKEKKLSNNALSSALTMLPLSLSDNPKEQLSVMEKRRRKMEKVCDPYLKKEQLESLKIIDIFIKEISSHE